MSKLVSASDIPTPSPNQSNGAVVCVFCGSSPGTSPAHLAAARSLAHALHAHSISLVYGGGTHGLMGELARTLVSLSGPSSVHGIIPEPLVKFEQSNTISTAPTSSSTTSTERNKSTKKAIDTLPKTTIASHNDSSYLPASEIYGRTTVVKDMHTRKQLMASAVIQGGPGSGFIALSGGYGTMEELFEVITWNQLGIHGKGVVVYNVKGYYDGLIQWVRTAVSAGFIAPGNAGILVEALDAEECVTQLRDYRVAGGRFDLDWSQK